MKTSLKRIATLWPAAVLLFCTTASHAADACTPAHKFTTLTPGVLSVSVNNFPPYDIIVSENEVTGVNGDIMKLIAAKECLTVKYQNLSNAAVIQSIVSGSADIAQGDWFRTAARAKVLGLTAPIYLDKMGLISKQGFDSITALNGKRVGAVQGDLWVPDMQKVFGSSLVLYPDVVAMVQDIVTGRIDAGVNSESASLYQIKKGGHTSLKVTAVKPDQRVGASIEPAQATWPHSKANQALGDAFSADFEVLRQSGDIARILKNYGLNPESANVGAPRLLQ